MKHSIILCAVAVLFFTACTTDKTRDFIPGTYINHAQGEFSIADDTLIIEPVEHNNFIVYRKTGFQRISNGKLGLPEHETEQWQVLYDEATKSLTETGKGKSITFYPEAKKLLVGKREYIKIN